MEREIQSPTKQFSKLSHDCVAHKTDTIHEINVAPKTKVKTEQCVCVCTYSCNIYTVRSMRTARLTRLSLRRDFAHETDAASVNF